VRARGLQANECDVRGYAPRDTLRSPATLAAQGDYGVSLTHGPHGEDLVSSGLCWGHSLPLAIVTHFADWLRDTHGFVAGDTDRLQSVPALIQGAFTRVCGHPTLENGSPLLSLLQDGAQPGGWQMGGFPRDT